MAKNDLGDIVRALKGGEPKKALKLLKPLLKRNPRSAALNDLAGVAFLTLDDGKNAAKHLEIAAKTDPSNPGVLHHLGEARRKLKNVSGAIEAFHAALKAAPDHVNAATSLAVALEVAGSPDAMKAYEQALALRPDDPALMIRLAGLKAAAGELNAAVALLRRAVETHPGAAAAQNNLGVLLTEIGQAEAAIAPLKQACALAPERPDYHRNRALALSSAGQYDQAVEAYRRSLALAPGSVETLSSLASLQERRSALEEAAELAEKALALEDGQGEATLVLARLARRSGDLDRVVALLTPILDREDLPLAIASSAATELGVAQDRRGDVQAAIAAFERANTLHDESEAAARIDRDRFSAEVAALKAFSLGADLAAWPAEIADPHPDPVFLVGFPRSGTTLTEQILAAHRGLLTTDEEPILSRTLYDEGGVENYPEGLAALDEEAVLALRARYFGLAESAVGALGGRRLVDKLPLNLIHLPAIRRIFPRAKVILALRDPRDVVLSTWMQNFDLNTAMIQFLKIETAAMAYSSVMDLWLSLRDRIGLELIEHRYEDMVADPEAATRRLIDFLDLEWDDALLSFGAAAKGKVISTPSARDVASGGVFTRARGRWMRYQELLAPALPVLAPYVDAFGYAPEGEKG